MIRSGATSTPSSTSLKIAFAEWNVVYGGVHGAEGQRPRVDIRQQNVCVVWQHARRTYTAYAAAGPHIDKCDVCFAGQIGDRGTNQPHEAVSVGPEKYGIGLNRRKGGMYEHHVVDRGKPYRRSIPVADAVQGLGLRQKLQELRRDLVARKRPVPAEYRSQSGLLLWPCENAVVRPWSHGNEFVPLVFESTTERHQRDRTSVHGFLCFPGLALPCRSGSSGEREPGS